MKRWQVAVWIGLNGLDTAFSILAFSQGMGEFNFILTQLNLPAFIGYKVLTTLGIIVILSKLHFSRLDGRRVLALLNFTWIGVVAWNLFWLYSR